MDLVEEYRTEGSDLFVLYEDLAFSVATVALALTLLAGAGLLLAGAGIGMRRLTRAPGAGPA